MKKNILCIIPARCGSKTIKNKNIREICSRPLLSWSVEQAVRSKLIDRVIVSTDSEEYAEYARKYGAEVPFLRPDSFAQDNSTDLDVFIHALSWLKQNGNYIPDICVHLRPTYPIRNVRDIDKCINILMKNENFNSVRSVAPVKEIPFKMWTMNSDGLLSPVVNTTIKDAYNLPRQELPVTYIQNACIDVVRTNVILESGTMTGSNIYGYIMDHNYDIDTEEEFALVASILQKERSELTV